ncbi:hypothetical protein VTK73DRAFT_3529 [Phialemonium thermophilum]|uniref:EXPERA domain-containing protein n=1 Tax=Phialemonium thermophilum TaxID=223376 RepID=A0ABR3Y0N3_9PEZI
MNTTDTINIHPYHPVGVEIPGYLANSLPVRTLLVSFFTGCAVILGTAFYFLQWKRPNLSRGDVLTGLWFALCGFIHFFFEGYFAYNFQTIGGSSHLFGQLWKEYSLSDSRYLTRDAFVTCMEAVTAIFWGPLSFTCVYLIATDHPLRHPLQSIVSLGQLYGDVLYYATCAFERHVAGRVHCRPESFYYWAYYMLCNSFWIVIPFVLVCRSAQATARAFARVRELEPGTKHSIKKTS